MIYSKYLPTRLNFLSKTGYNFRGRSIPFGRKFINGEKINVINIIVKPLFPLTAQNLKPVIKFKWKTLQVYIYTDTYLWFKIEIEKRKKLLIELCILFFGFEFRSFLDCVCQVRKTQFIRYLRVGIRRLLGCWYYDAVPT